MVQRQLRILVIAGGESEERDVSLQSGQCVAVALEQAGHTVQQLDPKFISIRSVDPNAWDIAFPVVHGAGGEDGVLQQELVAIGLPWIGCSAASSRLTFSKSSTRERLAQRGIKVAPGTTITNTQFPEAMELPVVVKPDQQGSSIGVSIVRKPEEWRSAAERALSFKAPAVVESFIDGREVSVPVIHGEALPAVEIVVPNGWYDYDAKYVSEATRYIVNPPNLPADLQQTAVRACKACGAFGILRVDFRIELSGQSFVLEINTIPGMTPHSLVPMAAAAAGQTLSQFCDRCVQRKIQTLQQ